jgi:hypothetical protein
MFLTTEFKNLKANKKRVKRECEEQPGKPASQFSSLPPPPFPLFSSSLLLSSLLSENKYFSQHLRRLPYRSFLPRQGPGKQGK